MLLSFILISSLKNKTTYPIIETKDTPNWSIRKLYNCYKQSFASVLVFGLLIQISILFIFYIEHLVVDNKLGFTIFDLLSSFTIIIIIQILYLIHCIFILFEKNYKEIAQIKNPYQRFYRSIISLHFSIIQHAHLRYKLYKKHLFPLRSVAFLNELSSYDPELEEWNIDNEKRKKDGRAELPRPKRPGKFTKYAVHLMESDGASWRFRHRLIQEWFAEKWEKEPKK